MNYPTSNFSKPGGATPPPGPGMSKEAGKESKKAKKAKEPKTTKRATRGYAAAAVLAVVIGGAGFVVLSQAGAPDLYVVRAKEAIPAFTHPVAEQLEAVPMNSEDVVDGAITGATAKEAKDKALKDLNISAVSTKTTFPVSKNQQLTESAFSEISAPLGQALQDDERIISISADAATSLAGQLRSGDIVDVYAASKTPSAAAPNGTDGRAVKVLAGIRVVSIAEAETGVQNTGATDEDAADPADVVLPNVYNLRVTEEQAATIAAYDANDGYVLYLAFNTTSAETEDATVTPAE